MKSSRKEQRILNAARKLEKRIEKIIKEEEGRGNKVKVAVQLSVEVSNRIGVITQTGQGVLLREVLYDTADK